jgi:hypothetical protein
MITYKVWTARISLLVIIAWMIICSNLATFWAYWVIAGMLAFFLLNRPGYKLKNWNPIESETLAIHMIVGLLILLAACSREMYFDPNN